MTAVHSPAYQRFLKKLRAARDECALTQREVAAALGKLPSYVAKCETGERRVDVIDLSDFAKLYRKPLSFFVE